MQSRDSDPQQRIVASLGKARRLLISSHIYPDGDAIGSELGLARALRKLGRDVTIVNANPPPDNLAFLDREQEIICLDREEAVELPEVDHIVVLDTSEVHRLGRLESWFRSHSAVKLCIDHHIAGEESLEMFDLRWSRQDAAATGCLVLELIEALGIALDASIAEPLYVAIATDTGWFQYANTDERSHVAAGRLVAAGARPKDLYEAVACNHSINRMALLGEVLSTVRSCHDGRYVYAVLTREMMERQGVIYEDIDGFVDELKVIRGIEVVALIVELSGMNLKVSLRSQGELNVNLIARRFGGGGHEKASGFRVTADTEALVRELEARVGEALQGLKRRQIRPRGES